MTELQEGMLLWRYGRELRQQPDLVQQTGWTPQNLRKESVSVQTLIDVGVANGTTPLYEAFPEAYRVLIEPLREFEPALKHLIGSHGEYVLAAVGSSDGLATIRLDQERPHMSSLVADVGRGPYPSELREVPVRTLDSLLQERQWKGPFGLKVDAEGFERHVIDGASRLLEETQFVIAELSIMRRYEDSYSFADFVRLMDDRGFALHDILDAQKFGPGHPILYIDVLFRPHYAHSDWAS